MKTYKRETAWALMGCLVGAFIYGHGSEHAAVVESAKFMATPVFLFAAGAFGLDAIAKQIVTRR
ncbi:hypothetical protein [Phaeobacter inhibens]|uniref:hypothetical protein n=1 Tax=Phaeobacter inhibens TaxID=221822 RepID=UPI000C9A16A7|nr:hypothetical protein [Phaeobacter inhibens]AUQ64452.1 hypothetical protein PhaeoP51_03521 [Phaeobacter inhibens]